MTPQQSLNFIQTIRMQKSNLRPQTPGNPVLEALPPLVPLVGFVHRVPTITAQCLNSAAGEPQALPVAVPSHSRGNVAL